MRNECGREEGGLSPSLLYNWLVSPPSQPNHLATTAFILGSVLVALHKHTQRKGGREGMAMVRKVGACEGRVSAVRTGASYNASTTWTTHEASRVMTVKSSTAPTREA